MVDHLPMSERAQLVLRNLVEMYIRDGQPVGSKALLRESAMTVSSATVRNIMHDLEELGLVSSPHTSAGRIPTVLGYRFFVDSLLSVQPLEASALQVLEQRLNPEWSASELIQSASTILSDITRQAGLVTLPRREQETLEQVEFVPLAGNRVLVVLVLTDREVQNRIIQTQRPFSREELQQAAALITRQFAGRSLAEAKQAMRSSLEQDRVDLDRHLRDALDVASDVLAPDDSPGADAGFMVAGQNRLLDQPHDMDRVRSLFDAFAEKREILDLLDRCTGASGVQLFIGNESGYGILDDYSVVTAPYAADGKILGVLGVIGPTRMAYQRVIPVVDATARLLSAALKGKS